MRRVLLAIVLVTLAIVILLTGSFVSSRIGTSLWRFVIAVALGVAIAWMGFGYFRQLGNPPPPDPIPESVPREIDLTYVCTVCGLELAIVKVAKDKAPKHCGEDMVLRVEGV